MISEVKFEDNYFDFSYCIQSYDYYGNTYELLINEQKYICSASTMIKLIDKLEMSIELCSLAFEKLNDIIIENNRLFLIVETIEGITYKTTFNGIQQRTMARTKFENIVYNDGYELLTTYIDAKEPVLINYKCGHGPQAVSPNAYLNSKVRCPVCAHQKIVPFVNDCYTIRPDLLKYFIIKEDAIGISTHNKVKMKFVCPDCGTIRENTLANISCFGFSCPVCGDGVSYPEKIMYSLLSMINIKFEYHYRPEWGVYDLDGKTRRAEYDFVIQDMMLIIETDGGFHFEKGNPLYKKENKLIDGIKDELAIKHGYNIIRIDSNYKYNTYKFEYITKNIIEQLSNIFDLSNIDWTLVQKNIVPSFLIKACELWNLGMTTKEISESININKTSIIEYLKRGTRINLCWYSKELSNLRQAKNTSSKYYDYFSVHLYDTNELIGVFYDIDNYIYNYDKFYGKKIRKQSIRDVCNKRRDFVYGADNMRLTFKPITKDMYDLLILNNGIINDIVDLKIPIVQSSVDYEYLYNESEIRRLNNLIV